MSDIKVVTKILRELRKHSPDVYVTDVDSIHIKTRGAYRCMIDFNMQHGDKAVYHVPVNQVEDAVALIAARNGHRVAQADTLPYEDTYLGGNITARIDGVALEQVIAAFDSVFFAEPSSCRPALESLLIESTDADSTLVVVNTNGHGLLATQIYPCTLTPGTRTYVLIPSPVGHVYAALTGGRNGMTPLEMLVFADRRVLCTFLSQTGEVVTVLSEKLTETFPQWQVVVPKDVTHMLDIHESHGQLLHAIANIPKVQKQGDIVQLCVLNNVSFILLIAEEDMTVRHVIVEQEDAYIVPMLCDPAQPVQAVAAYALNYVLDISKRLNSSAMVHRILAGAPEESRAPLFVEMDTTQALIMPRRQSDAVTPIEGLYGITYVQKS